jgi:putative tricarboxylic transport membrane protein
MKKNDLISGVFFLSAGLFFAFYARTVDIGSMEEPGPGYLPFWAGALLASMSALIILKALFGRLAEAKPFFPEHDSWKRILSIIASLIAYNFLLTTLGFTLITFLFVGFLVRFIFPQTWVLTLVTAALSTLGARLLFINLLELQFPKGFLGF